VRAEKVFVELPPLVGTGGETAGEQVFFVLAQSGCVADFSEDSRDFFSTV